MHAQSGKRAASRCREFLRPAAYDRQAEDLEADARVAAAWLTGSIGRGEDDAWSDLDLHIAVYEQHLRAFWVELRDTHLSWVSLPGQAGVQAEEAGRSWFRGLLLAQASQKS